MRFEQKHRELKQTANVSGSYKNIIHTLSIKAQLKLCYRLVSTPKPCPIGNFAKQKEIANNIYEQFFSDQCKTLLYDVEWIEIYGTKYKRGLLLTYNHDDVLPLFGIVTNIIKDEDNVYFILSVLNTICFIKHMQCYQLTQTKNQLVNVPYTNLYRHDPYLFVQKFNKYYVVVKHIL